MDPSLIQIGGGSNGEWTVKSNTDEITVYYVRLEKESCNCKLHCDMYGVCVHMYTCSCLDATLALHSVQTRAFSANEHN